MANTDPLPSSFSLFTDNKILVSNEELTYINYSPLLISLIRWYKTQNKPLTRDLTGSTSGGYYPDPTDGGINIKKTGADFVRLLGHELTHAYDDLEKGELFKTQSNFQHIIGREMDESEATAGSFIIRQQIYISSNGSVDIGISNRIGGFTPTEKKPAPEFDNGLQAEIAHLVSSFGSRISSAITVDDFWSLAQEIANDIWGKNFLTRPHGDTNRWEDRLEETYGDNIPLFLDPFDRTLQSAELLENGDHKFTFIKVDDGTTRTWIT